MSKNDGLGGENFILILSDLDPSGKNLIQKRVKYPKSARQCSTKK